MVKPFFQCVIVSWVLTTSVASATASPTHFYSLDATLGPIGENVEAVSLSGNSFIAGRADFETIVFSKSSGQWQEEARLRPWDNNGQIFGYSVGIDGDTAVVSNPWDNGFRGSLYIYRREGTAWFQDTKFTLPSDNTRNSWLGSQVAIDKDWIVTGAPRIKSRSVPGTAYVYHRENGIWALHSSFNSPSAIRSDHFGGNVDISANRMIIGASDEDSVGAAYIYELVDNAWQFQKKLTCPDTLSAGHFGQKLAINGDTAVIANPTNKTAYVFDYNGLDWVNSAVLTPSSLDNGNVFRTLDVNGDLIAVGDSSYSVDHLAGGIVSLFRRTQGGWDLLDRISSPLAANFETFGVSVSLESNTVVATAFGHEGNAFVFDVIPEPMSLSSLILAVAICAFTNARRARVR